MRDQIFPGLFCYRVLGIRFLGVNNNDLLILQLSSLKPIACRLGYNTFVRLSGHESAIFMLNPINLC